MSGERPILTRWYELYPWITVCSERRKIFCYLCKAAKARKLLCQTRSRKYQPAFVEDGFSNFKKATDKFRAHEDSDMHKEAVMKSSSDVSVDEMLSAQVASDQQYHRSMLMKLISTVSCTTRTGVSWKT